MRIQRIRKPLLRIAYTCRQGASHRIFILIAQVFHKLLWPFASLYLPFSRDLTLRLVRVMRMRWMATSVSTGALPVSLKAYMSGKKTNKNNSINTHTKKKPYEIWLPWARTKLRNNLRTENEIIGSLNLQIFSPNRWQSQLNQNGRHIRQFLTLGLSDFRDIRTHHRASMWNEVIASKQNADGHEHDYYMWGNKDARLIVKYDNDNINKGRRGYNFRQLWRQRKRLFKRQNANSVSRKYARPSLRT